MLPTVFSLLLFAQLGAAELQPEERMVLLVDAADPSARRVVRLVPSRVFKMHSRGVRDDAITARSPDSRERFVITAADLSGEDRKWFEREALKLWKRSPTAEFLLDELVRKQINQGDR